MECPNQRERKFAPCKQSKAKKRCGVQFKAAAAIALEKGAQLHLLLFWRALSAVLDRERNGYARKNFLPRLVHPLPQKARSQDAVPQNQPLPSRFQAARINRFGQMDHQLLDVHAGMRFLQIMKQHSLLERGKGETICSELLAHGSLQLC